MANIQYLVFGVPSWGYSHQLSVPETNSFIRILNLIFPLVWRGKIPWDNLTKKTRHYTISNLKLSRTSMLLNNLDVMILKDFKKIITICFQNFKKKKKQNKKPSTNGFTKNYYRFSLSRTPNGGKKWIVKYN